MLAPQLVTPYTIHARSATSYTIHARSARALACKTVDSQFPNFQRFPVVNRHHDGSWMIMDDVPVDIFRQEISQCNMMIITDTSMCQPTGLLPCVSLPGPAMACPWAHDGVPTRTFSHRLNTPVCVFATISAKIDYN
jgi:hypothetical protein